MSVSRSIKLRVLTKHSRLSDFIEKMTDNFWTLKSQDGTHSSITHDDNDDFDFKELHDIQTVYDILDKREKLKKENVLTLWDNEFTESISLLIRVLDNNYDGYTNHYELQFTLGVGKRIQKADRYTDYGYYLKQLLPKLTTMDCYVCEVECQDYDC